MKQVFETYLGLFLILMMFVVGLSMLRATMMTQNAKTHMTGYVKAIEESNLSKDVINECKTNATEAGYEFILNDEDIYSGAVSSKKYAHARLKYSYSVFGTSHVHYIDADIY